MALVALKIPYNELDNIPKSLFDDLIAYHTRVVKKE